MYRLRKDLVIPAGTEFHPGPRRTEYASLHVQAGVELGPDNTIDVTVPVEDDRHFRELFEPAPSTLRTRFRPKAA